VDVSASALVIAYSYPTLERKIPSLIGERFELAKTGAGNSE